MHEVLAHVHAVLAPVHLQQCDLRSLSLPLLCSDLFSFRHAEPTRLTRRLRSHFFTQRLRLMIMAHVHAVLAPVHLQPARHGSGFRVQGAGLRVYSLERFAAEGFRVQPVGQDPAARQTNRFSQDTPDHALALTRHETYQQKRTCQKEEFGASGLCIQGIEFWTLTVMQSSDAACRSLHADIASQEMKISKTHFGNFHHLHYRCDWCYSYFRCASVKSHATPE